MTKYACRLLFAALTTVAVVPAQLSLSLNADATVVTYPGDSVSWQVTVTNDGPTPVTISAFACSMMSGDPTGTLLQPSGSASFWVEIVVQTDAVPGSIYSSCASATSDVGGFAYVDLYAQIEARAPSYNLYQASGPGSLVDFACYDVFAGSQYHAVFTVSTQTSGIGNGPYFGLYAADPMFLIDQFLLPPNTPPFRFTGPTYLANSVELGQFAIPAGITLQWVLFYPRHFPPPGGVPLQWTGVQYLIVQ